jgi:UPF0176 protein
MNRREWGAASALLVGVGCCAARWHHRQSSALGRDCAGEASGGNRVLVLLFYKYVGIADVDATVEWVAQLATRLGLLGRILLATEGVNGTLSGPADMVRDFIFAMSAHALFGGIDWKTSDHDPECDLPFPDLLVKQVKEIVTLGTTGIDPAKGGRHLTPQEFHEAVSGGAEEVVLVDVRSTYEHAIGHFEGAIKPEMKEFSAFPSFVDRHADEWRGKKVLMYCTGGIRCEKASAYVKSRGVEDVSQLAGGIHRYLEQFPDGGHFKGKNFVFDQRIAVASQNTTVVGRCVSCTAPYDELSGSRLCTVCRDLVLVCPACAQALPEYHCMGHQSWKDCYFSFLDQFDTQELQRQALELHQQWEAVCTPAGQHRKSGGNGKVQKGNKNKRSTLQKQIKKVRAEIARRTAAGADDSAQIRDAATAAGRRCRTCGRSAADCDGNCFGFWRRDGPDKTRSNGDGIGSSCIGPLEKEKVDRRPNESCAHVGHHGRSKVYRPV